MADACLRLGLKVNTQLEFLMWVLPSHSLFIVIPVGIITLHGLLLILFFTFNMFRDDMFHNLLNIFAIHGFPSLVMMWLLLLFA